MSEDLSRRLAVDIPVMGWLCEPLDDEVRQRLCRLARAPDVQTIAVMPDVHPASDICVGVAFATFTHVYPQAVGGDIGCGMSAVRLTTGAIVPDTARVKSIVLRAIQRAVPILRHPRATIPVDVEELDPVGLSTNALRSAAVRDGRIELGTLGRGNHFLELQCSTDNELWLVVHSGSRAMGQAVRAVHMAVARRVGGGLFALDADDSSGLAYLSDAEWCVRYAQANRNAMLSACSAALVDALGWSADWSTLFGTAHNFVRRESIGNRELLVHRKGASDAREGVRAIIPGSMGAATHFVLGKGCESALCTSSHGAGRVCSRFEARRRVSRAELAAQLSEVVVDPLLIPKIADEAPSAYRDIGRVMRAQNELIRTTATLRTLVCHKGV